MKGTMGEGSFTGDPKRYIKQGLEMGVCFHRGPTFGEHERCFFLKAFLLREIFMRFLRGLKMPFKKVSVYHIKLIKL
jgi:hypothetical protein